MNENFYLSFPELPGGPYIALDTSFTIGAEVGDYILKRAGVSPRHCTFDIRKGVVTIVDHNTEFGTFIDGRRIDPGQMFILMPGDRVMIGKGITAELIHADHFEKTPHLDHWDTPPELTPDKKRTINKDKKENLETEVAYKKAELEIEQELLDEIENDLKETENSEKTEKISIDELLDKNDEDDYDDEENIEPAPPLAKRTEVPAQKIEIEDKEHDQDQEDTVVTGEAIYDGFDEEIDQIEIKLEERKVAAKLPVAGALSRFFAFLVDCLVAICIYNLLNPYESFDRIISFLRSDILSLFVSQSGFVNKLVSEFSFLIDFSSFLILFLIFSQTLIGVSIGQLLIGIYSQKDTLVMKRIKGFLRSIIGIITMPFLVFDIPALIPKRTFKEKVTKSFLFFEMSTVKFFRGMIVFYFSLFLAFATPLFQGFKLAPVIKVNDVNKEVSVRTVSQRLNEVIVDPLNVSLVKSKTSVVIPFPEIEDTTSFLVHPIQDQNNNKLNLGSSVIGLESVKDIVKLLNKASASNPMFSRSFPILQDFIKRTQLDSSMFKKQRLTVLEQNQLNKEFFELTKASLKLGIKGLMNHVQIHGPFIKGFLDFKVELLKDISSFENIKTDLLGNSNALIIEKRNIGENDTIIPLFVNDIIPVLKISPAHLTNAKIIFPFVYEQFFSGAIWGKKSQRFYQDEKPIAGLDLFRLLSIHKDGFIKMSSDLAMKIYGYYFRIAQQIISEDRNKITASFNNSIDYTTKVLQRSLETIGESSERENASKLINDLNDIKTNMSNMNREFFGLNVTTETKEEGDIE